MKISILAPNLSSNSFGRAYILAKVLSRKYNTEIVGPSFGRGLWSPLSGDTSILVKTIPMSGLVRPYTVFKHILKMIDGDILYCSKPLFTSLGIGLYLKKYDRKPLVLDIDDWEIGFAKDQIFRNKAINVRYLLASSVYPYKAYSFWNFFIMERFTRFADEITVSNSFLQQKFGGRIIWHGRNTHDLDPEKFDKNEVRNRYQVDPQAKIIMFFGTPRPHKGLIQLINSVKLLKGSKISLIIVGVDDNPYSRELINLGKTTLNENFRTFSQQPFSKVPEFLSMADVIAIPQERGHSTLGQIPAKIFDAMSMAKPIVATCVSDIPMILGNSGWIVEPGNIEHLSEALQYVLDHPKEADERGRMARQRCVQYYSWDSMENSLLEIFSQL